MDRNFLKQNARQLGTVLSNFQLDKFETYQKELLSWNKKFNLVSEKSAQEIVDRHFLDSLTALRFIEKKNARMLDIGSGAGFPGVPLKIALPSLELILMESNRKKVSFLKHIIRELSLEQTSVAHCRAEEALKTGLWQESFDIIICRAAFHLPELLRLSAFFLAEKGFFIALKGEDVKTELSRCVNKTTAHKLFELFQYDINTYPQGKKGKIIVGNKALSTF
ncbi:MAG TPA: 16S rRNA (guanine(527)-N(7))-methyltransferase RsmG [Deltaproteobacteria bacterium]|nr:16S rRNA (guanine(527)-N(7))-methyltransferase RsmG [Deltaproteobacteria bacterium]